MRRQVMGAMIALVGSVAAFATAEVGSVAAAPSFSLPFPCGQTWSGQTRTNHSPQNSIDFNRTDDLGDPVVASAAGTVITVRDLGGTSYGRYVVVDHGGGWRTYYAHLASFAVGVGQNVSKGERLGTVGSSGGSTGPHLHYEQRRDGSAVRVSFDGAGALYFGTRNYTSANRCGSGTAAAYGTVNTSGTALTVRSGPGTGYAAVGSVPDGQRVGIVCQTTGSSVTGTYGTSRVWDKLTTGGYVADAYVDTGSDGRVAPAC